MNIEKILKKYQVKISQFVPITEVYKINLCELNEEGELQKSVNDVTSGRIPLIKECHQDKIVYNMSIGSLYLLDESVNIETLNKYLKDPEFINNAIEKTLYKHYQKYQLRWLLENDYGLDDLLKNFKPQNDIDLAYENIYRTGIDGKIFLDFETWKLELLHVQDKKINLLALMSKPL